jgi:thiamine-monophosphate kinase
MREFELIKTFFDRGPAKRAHLGLGDDCALIELPAQQTLAVSSDMLVEGRHFFADVDPQHLGHKALAVNLSDLAAMGAQPLSFTLAIALPRVDPTWLRALTEGMFALADRTQCELIGGDTTQGPLNLSITVLGLLPKGVALRRDGAQVGDDVWVSGQLGGPYYAVRERYRAMQDAAAAAQGLGAAKAVESPLMLVPYPAHVPQACIDRLECPEPRLALGLALRHLASSAIDLSDGLLGDLGHLCERSRCGARVRVDQIPLHVELARLSPELRLEVLMASGDEYELCFTAAPENRSMIRRLSLDLGLPLTIIGEMNAGERVELVDADDRPVHFSGQAHQHFGS